MMAAFAPGGRFAPSGGEAAPFDPAQQMGYSMMPPSVMTPTPGMMAPMGGTSGPLATSAPAQSAMPASPSVPMAASSVPMAGTGTTQAQPGHALGALLSGLQGG